MPKYKCTVTASITTTKEVTEVIEIDAPDEVTAEDDARTAAELIDDETWFNNPNDTGSLEEEVEVQGIEVEEEININNDIESIEDSELNLLFSQNERDVITNKCCEYLKQTINEVKEFFDGHIPEDLWLDKYTVQYFYALIHQFVQALTQINSDLTEQEKQKWLKAEDDLVEIKLDVEEKLFPNANYDKTKLEISKNLDDLEVKKSRTFAMVAFNLFMGNLKTETKENPFPDYVKNALKRAKLKSEEMRPDLYSKFGKIDDDQVLFAGFIYVTLFEYLEKFKFKKNTNLQSTASEALQKVDKLKTGWQSSWSYGEEKHSRSTLIVDSSHYFFNFIKNHYPLLQLISKNIFDYFRLNKKGFLSKKFIPVDINILGGHISHIMRLAIKTQKPLNAMKEEFKKLFYDPDFYILLGCKVYSENNITYVVSPEVLIGEEIKFYQANGYWKYTKEAIRGLSGEKEGETNA